MLNQQGHFIPARAGYELVGVRKPTRRDTATLSASPENRHHQPIIGWTVDDSGNADYQEDCTASPIVIEKRMNRFFRYAIVSLDGDVFEPGVAQYADISQFHAFVIETFAREQACICVGPIRLLPGDSGRIDEMRFAVWPRRLFLEGSRPYTVDDWPLPMLPSQWHWELNTDCFVLSAKIAVMQVGGGLSMEEGKILRNALLCELNQIPVCALNKDKLEGEGGFGSRYDHAMELANAADNPDRGAASGMNYEPLEGSVEWARTLLVEPSAIEAKQSAGWTRRTLHESANR